MELSNPRPQTLHRLLLCRKLTCPTNLPRYSHFNEVKNRCHQNDYRQKEEERTSHHSKLKSFRVLSGLYTQQDPDTGRLSPFLVSGVPCKIKIRKAEPFTYPWSCWCFWQRRGNKNIGRLVPRMIFHLSHV